MSNHQKQSLGKLEKAKASKKEDKPAVNMRFVKGLELAASGNVRKIVPSTTSATLYKVQSQGNHEVEYDVIVFSSGEINCDCQDFQRRNITCKHIYAAVCSDVSLEVKVVATAKPEEVKREKMVYEP